MSRTITQTAAVFAASAWLAGQAALGVDPSRSSTGSVTPTLVPSPYTTPYLPGSINPAVYPGGSTLPPGVPTDGRARLNDPFSTIPGGLGYVTPISTTNPGTSTNPLLPTYVAPGTSTPNPSSTQQSRWKLGVYSKDTDTGVRIIQVVRPSAAERAGLEANDVIVCVSGYQVGYVNGVPYDSGYEFERNADANGWVTLLVQNNRDGKLINVPVQLESRFSRIDGTITYREYYSLPRDAVATVELRETLRPGAPPVTIARRSINNVTNVPISYSLDYDPSLIDKRRAYSLSATITSGGRTLFTTRRNFPVINDGTTNNVVLLVESATATGSQPGGVPYVSRDQQIEQIVQWFREYLHRDPRAMELAAWQSHVDRGGSLYDAQVQILSMPEYYNRADANDVTYIRQLHEQILGKQPTQQELAYWLDRMQANNRLRPEVAREFLAAVGVQR